MVASKNAHSVVPGTIWPRKLQSKDSFLYNSLAFFLVALVLTLFLLYWQETGKMVQQLFVFGSWDRR